MLQPTWKESLEALSRYVQGVDDLKHGNLDESRADAVARRNAQDHATVRALMQERPYLGELFRTMLLDASVLVREGDSESGGARTRDASTTTSTSDLDFTGRRQRPLLRCSRSLPRRRRSAARLQSQKRCLPTSGFTEPAEAPVAGDRWMSRTLASSSSASAELENGSAASLEFAPARRPEHDLRAAERFTTLTVYNVPNSYTQADLIEEWPRDGSYDFLYLRESRSKQGPKMVVINFVTHELAAAFQEQWHGRFLSRGRHGRPIRVVTSPLQGKDLNTLTVLESDAELPAVLHGCEWQSDDSVVESVRLAKHGLVRCSI